MYLAYQTGEGAGDLALGLEEKWPPFKLAEKLDDKWSLSFSFLSVYSSANKDKVKPQFTPAKKANQAQLRMRGCGAKKKRWVSRFYSLFDKFMNVASVIWHCFCKEIDIWQQWSFLIMLFTVLRCNLQRLIFTQAKSYLLRFDLCWLLHSTYHCFQR